MKIFPFDYSQSQDVINLYAQVFSDSEGTEEGAVIGRLVSDLITTTDENEIAGFVYVHQETIIGCIFFTRFALADETKAVILSPVAIATEQQGKKLGQRLIRHGIECLKSKGVELVLTYGDPAFYSKVGFKKISEDIIQAPFKLTQPIGWLAQSLKNNVIQAVKGPTTCVKALNKPELW